MLSTDACIGMCFVIKFSVNIVIRIRPAQVPVLSGANRMEKNSSKPILAYHAIFSTYGFWLPNDPRGSWSDFVWSWELYRYGPATKTDSRRSVAAAPHDRESRLKAKSSLKYQAVNFNGHQALAVAKGFESAITESNYRIHACAILPDHVHAVVARCSRKIETIVGHLKSKATM
jgi:hypothetical protein